MTDIKSFSQLELDAALDSTIDNLDGHAPGGEFGGFLRYVRCFDDLHINDMLEPGVWIKSMSLDSNTGQVTVDCGGVWRRRVVDSDGRDRGMWHPEWAGITPFEVSFPRYVTRQTNVPFWPGDPLTV